jgi:hypothetical protein
LFKLEHDFFTLIKRVKSFTDLQDAFGILRSLRRGFTSHAKNIEFPDEWINMMNRWRTERNCQTGAPRLDMVDV